MIVHPGSTNAIGLLTAVKAPVRRPDGTRNIKFTVAAFRPWRVSPASIASDPTFNAALRFAYPRRRLPRGFSPARAGCWYREPLPPRLARPKFCNLLTLNYRRWQIKKADSSQLRRPTTPARAASLPPWATLPV